MTRVNLLIPLFALNVQTNNPEVITSIVKQKYPTLDITNIYWLDSQLGQDRTQSFQCVIRSNSIEINFQQMLQSLQKSIKLEETINHLKNDLFNFVKVHEAVLSQKDNLLQKLQSLKNQAKDQVLEGEVSLKIDQKSKKLETQVQQEEKDSNLSRAVSDLTRQNIRLKDMLSYYQAQIEYLSKKDQELVQEKKEYNK